MRHAQLKAFHAVAVHGGFSREAAAQGLGLAIMSEGELVPDGRLAVLHIPDWETEMEEWMICLRSRSALHVIRSFFGSE